MKIIKNQEDKYLINEQINSAPFSGYVQIRDRDTGNLVADGHNLITFSGRRWLMHKALNIQDTLVPGVGEIDPLDGQIFYFGVGTGGATIGDPLTPIAPTDGDTNLAQSIAINDPGQDVVVGGIYEFADTGRKKEITQVTFSDVNNPVTNENELAVELRTVIEDFEAIRNDDTTIGTNVNEASIFVSVPTAPDSFILFSRITFSTIRKDLTDNKRGFIVDWFFLF